MNIADSSMNDLYYQELTQSLKQAGVCRPTLLIDKQRLDRNIDHLLDVMNRGFQYRIVAKSLPSVPLLRYIMRRTGSNRLMSFHVPFLIHLVQHIPEADVLLGKPMPISALQHFYRWHQNSLSDFNPASQLQWLVDSLERLQQYADFAEKNNQPLRINLEINIGLNRGGFSAMEEFRAALKLLKHHPQLQLSGLMGYEAHVTKIPPLLGGPDKAFRVAMTRYQQFKDLVAETMGADTLDRLCLNAGGSSTYPMYQNTDLVNEIATASALVKPSDFDVFTLEHHAPACFIAAPVLKDINKPELPMAPGLTRIMRLLGLAPKRGLYIYGGNWLANPCYPANSQRSGLLGHSSNQELYEVSPDDSISCDDFMFFRPSQSEAVFLQFGDIGVVDDQQIKHYWPVFQYPQPEYPAEPVPSPANISASR